MAWYADSSPEQVSTEVSSVVTHVTHPSDELPPSLYQEAHKVPLVLDLIGGSSAYGHFDMPVLTKEVDGYILEEVERRDLPDDKSSYQEVLNEALDKLALPEGTDVYATIEKVVRYFRIQHKLYTALKDKQALLEADPMTLSAPKLARYLEHHHAIR